MEILNILRIYLNIFLLSLWDRKITVMEFFFNKVVGCHLTKKGLHHSFIRMNFVKVFRSKSNQIIQFFLFLYQCSDIKQFSEKSFQKSSESNFHGVLFQWNCRFWGNWRKDFIIVSFGWFFCEIFQISFFLKQLWANLSVTSRPLWEFTSILEDVTVFFHANFDICSCAALPH